jgi:hypothetical protein
MVVGRSEGMEMETEFRAPTQAEQKIIARLLEADFPGKTGLQKQLSKYRVRRIDPEGSLALISQSDSGPALVLKRIPVEAEGVDKDGISIHVLLHVVEGFVKELEFYKDDGSTIIRIPDPIDLKLLVLSP